MTNDDKDLKPCPFCGDTKYLRVTYQDSKANASITGDKKYWGVFCMEKCGASIDSIYPTREEAIRVWNTRSTPQQPINGNTSDGYHTFNELYDHRCLLWINYCLTNPDKVYLVENHFDGWFLLGKETRWGQISYHCPNKFFNLVEKFERRHPKFDGHTSNDVINRLVDMAKPQQPSEPLKELEEQAVSDELQLRYFKLMYPDVTESDAEIVANSLSKAIVSKFGQPSEKKALSREEILDLFQTFQLTVDEYREKDFPCIPEWNFTDLINAIHSALPAQREVRYPEKITYYHSKKEYPQNCVEAYNQAIDEFKKLNGDKT